MFFCPCTKHTSDWATAYWKLRSDNLAIIVHENFLSPDEFDKLIKDIKSIENKFVNYHNEFFNYERIFLNDSYTENPIQVLIQSKLKELGYNNKNLDITVTSYQMAQKYDWHDDNTDNRTHNYILYLTNQEFFEGGELEIKINGEIKTITPKKNTLVIMDAKLQHRVLPVKTKIGGVWQLSRVTLNGHIKK